MIEEIRIENFQSHKDTVLKLADGLNLITGPSDSGKTAVIRALRWVLYNEPLGDDFIRVGARRCRVGILLTNGYRVIRERSKKENRYLVVEPDGSQEIYTGFGTKVPAEVKDLHQMAKVALDNDLETTLNLDYQLIGPFLLNDSGSTKAKAIGQLTGVHVIDAAIKDIARDLRRTKDSMKQETSEVERINEKLLDYQDLPQLKEEINKESKLLSEIKEVYAKLQEYQSLKEQRDDLTEEERELNKVLNKLAHLKKVESLYQQIDKYNKERINLEELQQDWQQLTAALKKADKLLKKLSKLDKIEKNYQQSVQFLQKREKLIELQQKLQKSTAELEASKKILEQTDKLEQAEEALTQVLKLKEDLSTLNDIKQDLIEVDKELSKKQKALSKLPKIEKSQQLISQIGEVKERLDKLKELKEEQEENQKNLHTGQKCITEVNQRLESRLEDYKAKLRELNRCPVCFNRIETDTLEQIIDNYSVGGVESE
ncbi:AAA family ATPase [Acetohalobium arabaticum]|uniref:Nuclease SbcCD subunit C n=1 Tax=Acetohalobium arabaticum (strain ATCC 49924 / DSM 5501 / Z-7288) TaxID=574087 RepID=D9QR46_ACEAZ|nr:AAA family ATPase [Acetohalobium arabaticum]ADL12987.1 SMC domain protein [Acetohalobium arabaticum DSM 5501]